MNPFKIKRFAIIFAFLLLIVGFQNFTVGAISPVELEGELLVTTEDYPNQVSRTRYFLKTSLDKKLELKSKGKLPHLLSGTKVRVTGRKLDNTLELNGETASQSIQVLALPAPSSFGEQKTAVLLVNFQSYPVQPFSVSATQDMVFNKTSQFYLENSFQQTWLAGQVFGWFTMAISFTCDTTQISTAAKLAAANAGVDLSSYSRYIYIFPANGACAWSGVGTVGGAPSESWINGELNVKVIGHEMGHNMGLYHSHALECGTSSLSSSCASIEYGDPSDIMGNLAATHFNSFQKEKLGWLPASRVVAVTNSGSYSLDPYESTGAGALVLKIPKGVDSSGRKIWYYLEYRQPIGYDSQLPLLYNSKLTSGVQVRLGTENNPDSSFFLDVTPNSIYADDMNDAVLLPGASYEDVAAGFKVSVVSVSAAGAAVNISLTNAEPPPPPPPPPSPVLSAALVSDKAVYAKGSVATLTGTILLNGVPASGVNVTFTITKPKGRTVTAVVSTDANGKAVYKLSISKKDPAGTYQIGMSATSGSQTVSANSSFVVQ